MNDPRSLIVDGVKTRYYEAGQGSPLVFIHGGQLGDYYNSYHWSLNFDDLSSDFHVYAFDKLGQGHTENPARAADYTMTATIEHAYQFLRSADIRGAVLVGHSRGALPAARIAIEHPEIARALVIIDSNTLAAEHPSVTGNFYRKLDENAPSLPDEEFVRREPEANSYSPDHITPDFVAEMLAIARLPKIQEARAKMEVKDRFLQDVRKQKYETLALIRDGHLKVPTLILWGANDVSAPLFLGYELYQQVALAVPDAQLHVFNRAGHYVFREHPRQLDRVIVNFIRQLD